MGDGASIDAEAGGSISAIGTAISFTSGANQVATFDNFTITNSIGDLVFVDPSNVTMNYTNSTLDAGSGNLFNTVGGSTLTVNASSTSLTGAIQTDATSTSTLAMSNGSTWTMTGSSTLTRPFRHQQFGAV